MCHETAEFARRGMTAAVFWDGFSQFGTGKDDISASRETVSAFIIIRFEPVVWLKA